MGEVITTICRTLGSATASMIPRWYSARLVNHIPGSALASTLVNVIAVRERVFRDDGTLDHVTNHVRPLPLISFIDPVFYQWTSVRLQGEFVAGWPVFLVFAYHQPMPRKHQAFISFISTLKDWGVPLTRVLSPLTSCS